VRLPRRQLPAVKLALSFRESPSVTYPLLMSTSNSHPNQAALWITVVVEALMIVAAGAYNIYEVRRQSALVQGKIEGLSEFSAQQGRKIDRMTTALETYVGQKLDVDAAPQPPSPETKQRIDQAIEFLEGLKQRGAE
jgi:hypothetical protein